MTKEKARSGTRVFAFGTLKRGFPLHEAGIADALYLGECMTAEPYPMMIAGPWFAPMMLNEPGNGYRVRGELYEVSDECLARLDKLESAGTPGNYRILIAVASLAGGPPQSAFAYMKARQLAVPVHSELLELYDDRRFIPPSRRPSPDHAAGCSPL
jgi:gamma-glutamylaminecyclotransferase